MIAILPFVCALAVTQTSPATRQAENFDYTVASPTAAQIDTYLARKRSPMAGLGESFSNYGRTYNVDPRLVVSIAGAETTFGEHVCADNNAWNWFYRRNCPQSPFATYEAGMERVAKFMRLSYINRGYDSIELIRHKYCAAGCQNWIPLVTTFYSEMPSNAAAAQPSPTAPNPAAPPANQPVSSTAQSRDGLRILGLPPFVLFFAAVVVVAIWASRALRS